MADLGGMIHQWLTSDPVGRMVAGHTDYWNTPQYQYHAGNTGYSSGDYAPSPMQGPSSTPTPAMMQQQQMQQPQAPAMQPGSPLLAGGPGMPQPQQGMPDMSQPIGMDQQGVAQGAPADQSSPLLQGNAGATPPGGQAPQSPTQPQMQPQETGQQAVQ